MWAYHSSLPKCGPLVVMCPPKIPARSGHSSLDSLALSHAKAPDFLTGPSILAFFLPRCLLDLVQVAAECRSCQHRSRGVQLWTGFCPRPCSIFILHLVQGQRSSVPCLGRHRWNHHMCSTSWQSPVGAFPLLASWEQMDKLETKEVLVSTRCDSHSCEHDSLPLVQICPGVCHLNESTNLYQFNTQGFARRGNRMRWVMKFDTCTN